MKRQHFTIKVTRKEFLTLPMPIRRKALRAQTGVLIKSTNPIPNWKCPNCHMKRASHVHPSHAFISVDGYGRGQCQLCGHEWSL